MAISTLIGAILAWRPESRGIGVLVVLAVLVYVAIGIGRWVEHKRLTSKPHIDFRIHETFITPLPKAASCFLRVSLHNEIGPAINNPSSKSYSLNLTINGKVFEATSQLDLENYELTTYRQATVWEDGDDEPIETEFVESSEPLHGIYTKLDDLVTGRRVEGWIAFKINYLPPWGTDKVEIGNEIEYDYDGDEFGTTWRIEESARQRPLYKDVPHTRNVSKLTLTVLDSYNQPWETQTEGPFNLRDKRINLRRVPIDV